MEVFEALAVADGGGAWLFESVTVEKWMGDGVPWVGDPRARSAGR